MSNKLLEGRDIVLLQNAANMLERNEYPMTARDVFDLSNRLKQLLKNIGG